MLVLLTIALLVALFGVVKPFKGFKRTHFGIAAISLFIACLIATPSPDKIRGTQAAGVGSLPLKLEEQITAPETSDPNSNPRPADELASASPVEEDDREYLTAPQRNAVRSAEQYLNIAGFSREGLIDQLSSDAGDGYSVADATAAVDSLGVDWNENAARSARQYLSISGFSCKGLIEQLSSSAGDKYTAGQAAYGARQAGAC